MSMTSVSLSCAIRPARSGGGSGNATAGPAAGSREEGGVQNTFGAGAVPATPRTPGVPQPSSSAAVAMPRVAGRNACEAATLRAGTSGGRVANRACIVRYAEKGLSEARGSHYTHTRRRSWTIPCREERRHVGGVSGAAGSVALGRALLQDPRARGRGHRWGQGRSERCAGQAGEAARRGRPTAHPPRPVRVPRGGARPVGASRPSGGSGGPVRRGRRGQTIARASRPAATPGSVAPVRGKGKAHEERAARDREAQRRVTTDDGEPSAVVSAPHDTNHGRRCHTHAARSPRCCGGGGPGATTAASMAASVGPSPDSGHSFSTYRRPI